MLCGAMFVGGMLFSALVLSFAYKVERDRRIRELADRLQSARQDAHRWQKEALKKGSKALQERHDDFVAVLMLFAQQDAEDALPAIKLRIIITAARETLDAYNIDWKK